MVYGASVCIYILYVQDHSSTRSFITVATMDGSSSRKKVVTIKVVKNNCDPISTVATMDGSSRGKKLVNVKGMNKACKWIVQIRVTKRLPMRPFKSHMSAGVLNVVL